jgi:mono/diheme cytochrome c family protein
MSATREWRWALQVGLVWMVAACGGGDRTGRGDTTAMTSTPPAGEAGTGMADTARDTAMAPAAAPAAPAASDSAAGRSAAGTASKAADTARKAAAPTAAKPAPPAPKPAAEAQKPAAEPKPAAAAQPAAGGAQSPRQVALGDSIFHGQVAGGTCTACHGQDAKGTAIAPDLTDSEWLNGDGSYDFIVQTITNGVPTPKQHPAPMPPKGGAMLSDEQVKAAAAYVYSLSHTS